MEKPAVSLNPVEILGLVRAACVVARMLHIGLGEIAVLTGLYLREQKLINAMACPGYIFHAHAWFGTHIPCNPKEWALPMGIASLQGTSQIWRIL